MTDRIFIALELPPEHRKRVETLLSRWARTYPAGINWVKPVNLHLTVLFVGDVETGIMPDLCEAVASVSQLFTPIDLSLWGCELFPANEPRLLWVKLSPKDQRIYDLPRALLKALRPRGCTPDVKPLKLHVTLGRIKRMPVNLDAPEILSAPIQTERLPYSCLSIYDSILRPDGPEYHLIDQYDLNKENSGGNNAGKE